MNKVSCLLSIAISLIFLYYILEIEKEDCNCVNDWRLRYIKMYNGGLILVNIVLLLLDRISINLKSYILSILMILNVIHVYAVYTLIDELEKQRCACAVEENKHLHNVLYYYRYVMLLSIIGSFLILVSSIRILLLIGDSYNSKQSINFSNKGGKMIVKRSKK
jgi:hypothetical protein